MRSALGVDEFPRRDHFRDTNDVDFTKDIAKSLADRCKSSLTIKMSNATLSKHSVRRKWRFFPFSRIISRRTMNLTFPDTSGVDFVLFCRWYRVSTTLLSRVVDDRSNTAWRWRLNSTTIIEWRTMCLWGTHLYSVYGAGGCGEVKGVSRFARI